MLLNNYIAIALKPSKLTRQLQVVVGVNFNIIIYFLNTATSCYIQTCTKGSEDKAQQN